jgi:hypothetical protein
MKTLLILAAGVAALSVAACNKPAEETAPAATTDGAMSATDSGSNASSDAPASSGAMSPSSGASSNAPAAGAMAPASSAPASTMSGAPAADRPPTTQETVAATRGTLSPAGASSGPTAPH